MRRALVTIGLGSLFLGSACGKSEAPAADKAVTSPSVTAPAAAPVAATASAAPSASAAAPPPPKCPEGLTGNAVPAYCIKLPPGYTVKEARVAPSRGNIDYATGTSTDILTVTYDATSVPSLAKDVESEMKFGHDKLEKKGNLPGGNKWFQGSHDEYARIVTLIKGPPPLTLKCSFAYQPKKPPPKLAIDACKSIVVP
jgi:hypothetical protein